jgi:hypothetical protein
MDDYDYTADDAAVYNSTRTTGVYSAEDDFGLTIGDGLAVTIGAGMAWASISRFVGRAIAFKEQTTLTMATADAIYGRYDLIVIKYDGEAKAATIESKVGVPGETPSYPTLERTATVYELGLYGVYRPAGSTGLTMQYIEDLRANEDYCGIMRDGVTRIPTDTLLEQFRAATEDYIQQLRAMVNGPQGWYATEADLNAAVPTGQAGYWAIVGATNTLWVWDTSKNKWHDSQTAYDLSDYITTTQLTTAIAGFVKTINNTKPDSNGNVAIDVGVLKINSTAPDSSGNLDVSIPTIYNGTTAPASSLGKVGDLYVVT